MARRQGSAVTARVVVGVLTYDRLEGLERLLRGLAREAAWGAGEGVWLGVVVVSNHAGTHGAVASLVERVSGETGLSVRVEVGPGGIPGGRNAAVRAGLGWSATHVGFLDDDEWVEAGWLCAMLGTLGSSGADVVAGPVVESLPAGAPGWVSAGRFFSRPRRATGSVLGYCYTGNVLARASVFASLGLGDGGVWFDEGLTGVGMSEDWVFFRRAHRAGARIVWCDEAVVREAVPLERCTAGYLVERMRRIGQTTGRAARVERGLIVGGLVSVGRGCAWLVIGAWRRATALCLKRGAARTARVVRGWRGTAYGLGVLEGVFGRLSEGRW